MRLAHVSDLHFGHHDPAVSAGLAADLKSQSPDLVVASGDFTQRGTAAEFQLARDFLDSVHAPVFAVPGNHDLGKHPIRRFLNPYGYYRRYIAPEVEPYRELSGDGGTIALAGLNTTRRALIDRDWSNGSINKQQLAHLEQQFSQAPAEALRIVVAHHPLMQPQGQTLNSTQAVRRAGKALEA